MIREERRITDLQIAMQSAFFICCLLLFKNLLREIQAQFAGLSKILDGISYLFEPFVFKFDGLKL